MVMRPALVTGVIEPPEARCSILFQAEQIQQSHGMVSPWEIRKLMRRQGFDSEDPDIDVVLGSEQ